MSRCASRSATTRRLSARSRPRPSAISTFTRPSLKYIRVGTSVRPFSRTLPLSESISLRCRRSLRSRSGWWPSGPPCAYSEMDAPMSHASPSRMSAYAWPIWTCPSRGLHLGSGEDHARFDALDELVVAPCAAVLRDQLGSGGLGHRGSVGTPSRRKRGCEAARHLLQHQERNRGLRLDELDRIVSRDGEAAHLGCGSHASNTRASRCQDSPARRRTRQGRARRNRRATRRARCRRDDEHPGPDRLRAR